MGLRGRSPKSKKTLENRGSRRAKDRPDDLELEAEMPKPPAKWDKEALAEWNRIIPVLAPKGVLASVDRAALITMCESWSDYCKYRKSAQHHNEISIEHRRLMILADRASGRWRGIARSFGLTAEDRPRVKVPEKSSDEKKKERFFKPRIANTG